MAHNRKPPRPILICIQLRRDMLMICIRCLQDSIDFNLRLENWIRTTHCALLSFYYPIGFFLLASFDNFDVVDLKTRNSIFEFDSITGEWVNLKSNGKRQFKRGKALNWIRMLFERKASHPADASGFQRTQSILHFGAILWSQRGRVYFPFPYYSFNDKNDKNQLQLEFRLISIQCQSHFN